MDTGRRHTDLDACSHHQHPSSLSYLDAGRRYRYLYPHTNPSAHNAHLHAHIYPNQHAYYYANGQQHTSAQFTSGVHRPPTHH